MTLSKANLPEPFQRPKIEVSAAGREWIWVTPDKLSKNDIVSNMGLVDEVIEDSEGSLLKCRGMTRKIPTGQTVFAFTRKPT